MNTQNIKTAASESSERWGENQNLCDYTLTEAAEKAAHEACYKLMNELAADY